VGGIIVAAWGPAAAFAANAASYFGLLTVLSRWKPPAQPQGLPREAVAAGMMAGVRYVAMSPNLLKVILRAFLFGATAGSLLALLPVVASTMIGGSSLTYGLLLGAFGLGAVGGALISGVLHEKLASEDIVRLAFLGFSLSVGVTGVSSNPWITGLALAIGGACWVLALSLFNVTVQLSAPRWVVARALSIYQTGAFGGMALGSWLWGVAGEQFGVSLALVASSLSLLLAGAVGFVLPLPPRVSLDLDPANRWKEPQIEVELESRSGPVVVVIEYVIHPEDLPAFLGIMAERKRVRRRDGAHDWTLMRDLAHANTWVESFRNPTWVEYVRHSLRLTHADESIYERLLALHQGPDRPRVRRLVERPPNTFAEEESRNPTDPA